MANRKVSVFVRYKENGERGTAPAAYAGNSRLKPGFGVKKGKEFPCPGCIYWIRWYVGEKQEWQRVGSDPTDAMKAVMRQEDILAGGRPPVEERSDSLRVTLASAIEDFLQERS